MFSKIFENLLKEDTFNINDILKNIFLAGLDIILSIVFVIILTKLIVFFVNKVLIRTQKAKGANNKRIETITSIIDNLIRYIMGIVLFIFILLSLGISWPSLLATTGVLGVIIGLGANELIKDTVNGFFVIFEGTYDIGEYVIINNFEGYVVGLGIKSTVLKNMSNEKITIPNSKVEEVINLSKNDYINYYYFSAPYEMNAGVIEKLVNESIIPMSKDISSIISLEFLGLDSFLDSSISYGLKLKSKPENRFLAKRELNLIIKKVFDQNNIEIPYKNITISYKKEN